MKKIFLKVVNILLCLAMVLSFLTVAGCNGNSGKSKGSGKKLFSEPVEFTVLAYEHTGVPYTGTELKFKEITEKTNVTLKMDITPQSEYNNKISTVFASGQMYDITVLNTNAYVLQYSTDLFLDLTDYLETELKDYYRWIKDDENAKRTLIDGRLYQLIQIGVGDYPKNKINTMYGNFPVIRYDVLDENNLSVPESWNDWFTTMKKLKTIYPNSTPWATRSARTLLRNASYSLGAQMDLYYNFDTKKYSFGVMENNFREILEFLINCYNEGIIDPNFNTSNTNTWENAVSSGNVFFWYDNNTFAPSQTATLQKSNPKAKLEVMPLMEGFGGKKQATKYNANSYNGGFILSSKTAEPKKLVKFMNWLYTDEGFNVCNYGKEGKTYTLNSDKSVNISKDIINEFAAQADPGAAFSSTYGVGQLCFSGVCAEMPLEKAMGKDVSAAYEILKDDYKNGHIKEEAVTPAIDGSLISDTETKVADINNLIYNHIMNIVIGKLDISTLDLLVTQIKDMGAQTVLDRYNSALPK